MPIFTHTAGAYSIDLPHLLAAARFCKAHPEGRLATGMWIDPTWTATDFWRWFRTCLHTKINRDDTRAWRKLRADYQADLAHDVRLINDYTGRRIRHSGSRGLLRTAELRRRYPHINTQEE